MLSEKRTAQLRRGQAVRRDTRTPSSSLKPYLEAAERFS